MLHGFNTRARRQSHAVMCRIRRIMIALEEAVSSGCALKSSSMPASLEEDYGLRGVIQEKLFLPKYLMISHDEHGYCLSCVYSASEVSQRVR